MTERAYRPTPGAPVMWPDAFGTRFAVFVDTEEEFDWSRPLDPGARSVTATAVLPAAHRRLVDRGALPGYLADHPVAIGAPDVLRTLAEAGAEIGAQLHPWVNPPHGVDKSSFAGTHPATSEGAKLDVLTDAVAVATGVRPTIYRAGRYGIGPRTAALLAARGYRIDMSMRARFDYADIGGPDFSAIGVAAFHLGDIVELPFSTIYTGVLRRFGMPLHRAAGAIPHGRGMLARSGLLSRVPLTPEGVPLAEALEAIRVALDEGVRVLNFAFHSPSLVPGHTPFVRDARDLARFEAWWDGVLALLAARGVRAVTGAELAAAAR